MVVKWLEIAPLLVYCVAHTVVLLHGSDYVEVVVMVKGDPIPID